MEDQNRLREIYIPQADCMHERTSTQIIRIYIYIVQKCHRKMSQTSVLKQETDQ